jgi:hypothetical protein
MTPKEKAAELVDRFTFADIYFTDKIKGAKLNAKQCALIAADEIINSCPTRPTLIEGLYWEVLSDLIDDAKAYWQSVKSEIEKL